MKSTFTTSSDRNHFQLLVMNLFLFFLLVLVSSLAFAGLKYFLKPFDPMLLVTIGSILAAGTLVVALKKNEYKKKEDIFLAAASFFYAGCVLAFCIIVI
jgi:hypothetical protein